MSLDNLSEEEICGFKVSTRRKQVWQRQLKMVKLFIDICQKHNLKYFAAGGTLLGAIRHGGYIPWDDDVDLMMPRDDYEKFIDIAQSELPQNYFLQCSKTEKNYPNGHAQIRDNGSACFLTNSYYDLKLNKNCGIFIDIFPYDVVPEDSKKRAKQAKKVKKYKKLAIWKVYGKTTNSLLKRCVKALLYGPKFIFHDVEYMIAKMEKFSRMYNGTDEQCVALISFLPGYEPNVWKRNLFDGAELHDFEDIKIAVPVLYDEALKTEFGDYMQIPENKAGSVHGSCYFDLEKPYTEYKKLSKAQFNATIEDTTL